MKAGIDRIYTREFRDQAVKQVIDLGARYTQLASVLLDISSERATADIPLARSGPGARLSESKVVPRRASDIAPSSSRRSG